LATTGSHEHLFASVRELEPLIRAHQASADRLGCMPAAVMDAFFERDLFRILLPSDFSAVGTGLRELRPIAFAQAGLLVLVATPVVRVMASVVAFALERDRLYTAITLAVLAILLISLFGLR